MAIDPVCTMKVDDESTEFTSEYDGETYYFCSNACKKNLKAPQNGTSLQRSSTAAAVFCVFAGVAIRSILQSLWRSSGLG